jgi:hypothetical protein
MAKTTSILKNVAKIIGSLAFLMLLALTAYFLLVQPWHVRWGTTNNEAERLLPGDDIVPQPDYRCTRAITIRAPAAEVWPWLLQIGQDRGGFYSYNWIENLFGLDIHNVYHIVPEWQNLEVGDKVNLSPYYKMTVSIIEPSQSLVYNMPSDEFMTQATWAFILFPLDLRTTRLIIRMRIDIGVLSKASLLLFDPGHFIMERKMMYGIKECTERTQGITTGHRISEAIWFISIIIAGLGILILLFSRRWLWTLLIASLGTISLILVFFRAYSSPLYGCLLALSIIGALIWSFWPQKQSQTNKRSREIIP